MTTTEADLWAASYRDEVDSAYVYRAIADSSRAVDQRDVYLELARTEQRHAEACAARLRDLGRPVPEAIPSRRARIIAVLGRRFGPEFVQATLSRGEDTAERRYRVLGDDTLAADESGHGRALAAPRPEHAERHRLGAGNTLRASVLGANDGLLSNFSLLMGVAGAGLERSAVLVTGLAGLLAGAGSMALGEWISVQSSREYHEHELANERREIELAPDFEREELEVLYRGRGHDAAEAAALAGRALADPKRALETMAREELGIDPQELGGSPWVAAVSSFLLFCVGAIVPVIPYLVLSGGAATVGSVALSAFGLFAIGAAITLVTGRPALVSGARQLVVGVAAAAVTYGVGTLLGTAV